MVDLITKSKVLKRLSGLLIIMVMYTGLFAQDIHFSQYYATPLLTNPANTGNVYGLFRVTAIYRNQWFTVIPGGSVYSTIGASFDMAVMRDRLGYDQMGVGLVLMNDRSAAGALTNITAMGSFAYSKVLDSYANHFLSFGVQAGIVQKRIDYSKLTFEEQFISVDDGFGDPSANGEAGASNSMLYPDFQVGLILRSRFSKSVATYLGVSAAHLHQPKEEFLSTNDEINRLGAKYSGQFGAEIKAGDNVSFLPSVLFMYQSSITQVNAGFAVGYKFNSNQSGYFGPWLRASGSTIDALIVMAAYEFYDFRVGISYDVNISDFRAGSNSVGAIEASLIYIYKNNQPEYSPTRFCPKF